MTTYPLPTLSCTIDATGIRAPAYEDILASLEASYTNIFGSDVSLDPSTQDGGWLAYLASMQNDTNQATIAAYNAYSPTYAQGAGLSSLVKINGLRRDAASNSTVLASIAGVAGTLIPAGIGDDGFGNQWTLPANTVIPNTGAIIVTLTCQTPGNVTLASGASLTIATPQQGFQSITTTAEATLGAPVETDAALRGRQAISTSLPAQTPLEAILAAVANVAGVEQYSIYENDTDLVDANGIPSHSIAVVVLGGDAQTIAQVIQEKKSPGCGTYGTTQEIVLDPAGVPDTINFFYATQVTVYAVVTIQPLAGYISTTGPLITAAVAAAIGQASIGNTVYLNRLWAPANLSGDAALSVAGGLTQKQLDLLSASYNVTGIAIGTAPNPTGTTDLPIAFDQIPICPATNVSLVVLV